MTDEQLEHQKIEQEFFALLEEFKRNDFMASQHDENEKNVAEQAPRVSIAEKIASFFSSAFSPLIIPTYAVAIALNGSIIGSITPLYTRILVTLVILALTCMIPSIAIAILYKLGKISDPGVNKQQDRIVPYIIAVMSYVAAAVYLSNINAPIWIPMFMIGGGIAVIASALINLKWKISAHGAGMGGLTALMFSMWVNGYVTFDLIYLTSLVILLTGAVGTSRLILNRHTLAQVLAGTLNGFFWVFILTI